MLKQERIKLDRNSLTQQGYKKIKLINCFNYYDDYETSVTVYRAKIGKETHYKYFFPNELNPDTLWKKVKQHITEPILSYHSDFLPGGIIYNALVEREDKKLIMLIRYSPTDGTIECKEARFDGAD